MIPVRPFALLAAWSLLLPAWAADDPAAATLPEQGAAAEQQDPWLDSSHEFVSERLQRVAIWVDQFFGDPRADIDKPASAHLNVVFDNFYSGVEDESEYGVKFRGGAELPRIDRRLQMVFTSDADASVTGADLAGIADDRANETDTAVGLRYLFRDRPGQSFSLGGGASGGLSPEVLIAARHRYTKEWGAATASHVTSTLYWKSDGGAGISSLIDYEWAQDPATLWRYSLFGNYRDELDGFEWSGQAKWARRLDDRTAIQVRGGVEGQTEPESLLTEGWLRFLYRRNVLRSWLFCEFEPGLSWHERVAYQTEPTIALRFEVQFRQD